MKNTKQEKTVNQTYDFYIWFCIIPNCYRASGKLLQKWQVA